MIINTLDVNNTTRSDHYIEPKALIITRYKYDETVHTFLKFKPKFYYYSNLDSKHPKKALNIHFNTTPTIYDTRKCIDVVGNTSSRGNTHLANTFTDQINNQHHKCMFKVICQ